MKKRFIIIVIATCCAFSSFAADNYNLWWQKGNSFYKQKQYDSAAWYFEQVAALKPLNPEVYYNLGNTYYRLNLIPNAVLNYERVLMIDPDYKDAKDNLALTQSRISNRIAPASDVFFITWWKALTMPHRATVWAVISWLLFIGIIGVMLQRHYRKAKGRQLPAQLPGILSLFLAVFLILAYASAMNNVKKMKAVVMENDAPLMNAEQKGKPMSLVPAGTTIEIKNEINGWAEVLLPDGRNGWLQENVLNKI